MEPDEYRRSSLEMWETMAPGWERWQEEIEKTSAPIGEWLIGELAPQPGDTLLELAAGPGGAGFAASPMLGESGRLSPPTSRPRWSRSRAAAERRSD